MWGLTKKQKDQIGYLRAAISCDEKTAMDLLRKTNWDVDRACEIHFGDPKNQEKAKPKASQQQEKLFEKYKEKTEDVIGSDGLVEFLQDIGVDPLDPTTLVFSYLCGAKAMGQYTKDEFVAGLASLKANSNTEVKSAWKSLAGKLDDEKEFKEVYRFTFNFAKGTARNLNFDSARALWEILLKGRFPFLDQWLDFCDGLETKTDITKDTWNMLQEFNTLTRGKIENYVDDGAWPVMIDEFVEHLKNKK